jgi:hypothetical protein
MRSRNRSQYLTATLALALAAVALFPALARAGSSEVVYPHPGQAVNNPFEARKKPDPSPKGHPGPGPSTTSPAPNKPTVETETTEPSSEPEGEAEAGNRRQSKAAPPNKPGNRPPGGGSHQGPKTEAKPSGSAQNPDRSSRSGGLHPQPTATGVNASDTSGGSSRVVPILIAVALLAALSIGVAIYRDRRAQPGAGA